MARKRRSRAGGPPRSTAANQGGSAARANEPATARAAAGAEDLVVFWTLNDAVCSECGEELARGSPLRLEGDRPLCLACADLDHLVFLARGNAALTRRATKHSTLRAVVVRFSRARKRYERQGILIEEEALARAEEECLADADARAARQAREALRRAARDAAHVAAFAERIGEVFPGCPAEERGAIAKHACEVRSGRVGRTAAAKELDADAVELAVRAHVRHRYSPYDRLLGAGMERSEARLEVGGVVDAVVEGWRSVGRPQPKG